MTAEGELGADELEDAGQELDDMDDEVDDEVDEGEEEPAGRGSLETDYEPGDVNTLGPGDEPADVNTVAPSAAGRGAPAGAGGETSVEVLTYLARSMADDPEAIVVRRDQRRGATVLRLHVAPGDMGRIIGRRGRTAQAIRTLVGVAGARDGVQTLVDIDDD